MVVEKLGGGPEAARSMGELLSGVGSLLASEAAVDQVLSACPFSLYRALRPPSGRHLVTTW